MSPAAKGKRCAVLDCRRVVDESLPLTDEDVLDIDVCGPCAREIERDPSVWSVTSLPIHQSRDEKTVVRRTDEGER